MGEAKRKTYTPAFKAKVGLEAIRAVRTVNEIGRRDWLRPSLGLRDQLQSSHGGWLNG
jgi:hypothetical protein